MRTAALPDFPWDSLAPYKERASSALPAGSSTCRSAPRSTRRPTVVQDALRGAADAPGYPQTYGTPALREAVAAWFARRRGVPGRRPRRRAADDRLARSSSPGCRPCSASAPGDVVGLPRAWPTRPTTWAPGSRARRPCRSTASTALGPLTRRHAEAGVAQLPQQPDRRGAAGRAPRQGGRPGPASTASSWPATSATPSSTGGGRERPASVPSILDPRVCGGSHEGLLAVYSLSQAVATSPATAPAFVAGDPALVARLLEVRKHAGMIVPWPGAAGDDGRARRRRPRRRAEGAVRRAPRHAACGRSRAAGFRVDHSDAGLYLWATRGEDCWATVGRAGRPRASSSRRAASTATAGSRARAGRADRDRRADRRRRRSGSSG